MKLCSACLLGVKCRYDGNDKQNDKVIELAKQETLIPVCPEQLGGLPTPREPAELKDDRVITKSGKDITENVQRGAEEALRLAKLYDIKEAILKSKSPSCGYGQIYDGTFSGNLIEGKGLAAKFLEDNGIKITPEDKV